MTIFYFLKSDDNNKCWTEVTGKQCNLQREQWMQGPCLLILKEEKLIFIDYKIYYLAVLWEYTSPIMGN